jgi:hypothetical protein
MTPRQLARRAGVFLTSPLSLLLVILFFLPWLQVRCGGVRLASASGLDLTVGRLSPNERLYNDAESPGQEQQSRQEAQEKRQEEIRARPWFALGLLLPLVALGLSLLRLAGRLPLASVGLGLTILAVAGIVLVLLATGVEYDEVKDEIARHRSGLSPDMRPPTAGPQDTMDPRAGGQMGQQMGQQMAEGMAEQMAEGMGQAVMAAVDTRATPVLWVSLVVYIVLLLCGVWSLAASVVLPPVRARAVSTSQREYNSPDG